MLAFVLACDAYCLVDLAGADEVRSLPKMTWALIICVFGPVGGIAYLSLGKVR